MHTLILPVAFSLLLVYVFASFGNIWLQINLLILFPQLQSYITNVLPISIVGPLHFLLSHVQFLVDYRIC